MSSIVKLYSWHSVQLTFSFNPHKAMHPIAAQYSVVVQEPHLPRHRVSQNGLVQEGEGGGDDLYTYVSVQVSNVTSLGDVVRYTTSVVYNL